MVTSKLNLNASVVRKIAHRCIFQDIWHTYAAQFSGSHLTVNMYVADFGVEMLNITEIMSM